MARHLDWCQGTLVPEAVVRYAVAAGDHFERRHYIADLMWVTQGGTATEIEVKVSRSDWRADLEKGKWGRMPRWVARFVYAVPKDLGIPEWVPPTAGVWHVDGNRVRTARAPTMMARGPVPASQLEVWRQDLYRRYWTTRLRPSRLPE